MPDKHEVGGSTPLEPTRATEVAKAKRAKRKRNDDAYTKYKRKSGE